MTLTAFGFLLSSAGDVIHCSALASGNRKYHCWLVERKCSAQTTAAHARARAPPNARNPRAQHVMCAIGNPILLAVIRVIGRDTYALSSNDCCTKLEPNGAELAGREEASEQQKKEKVAQKERTSNSIRFRFNELGSEIARMELCFSSSDSEDGGANLDRNQDMSSSEKKNLINNIVF